MIPVKTSLVTVTSGALASADFEISTQDQEHIMALLRDGLYTDRIAAILREYGANAFDAHISVGKGHVPIKITLPTQYEPVLRIRDYGPGLSHEDVFNVYNKYGRSTKRTSNDVVGCLGIGSKSGFAYSDSFTITSWHDGVKRVYVAVKYEDATDGKEKSRTDLFAEVPCDPSETGVEIQIATRPEDRYEFERTARRLFRHMTPRPEINIELPALPDEQTVLTNGTITPHSGEWIAVMGCVPYRINLANLDERLLNKCLPNLSGLLKFDIGAVTMSASREELKYTNATKAALIAKFDALIDEFVTHALAQLDAGKFTGWETRLRVQVLAKLDLPLPEKWKPFAEGFAKVTYDPSDFTIIHNKAACTRLLVTENTRLLIDDTGNELSGYYLGHDDYVVRSVYKAPELLRATLDAALVTSGLVGVKVELLSSLHWAAPVVPVKKKANPKHRARMFQLAEKHTGKAPWSNNWEPVTRVPTADDVYVIIEGFKPEYPGDDSFWSDYSADRALAKAFDATMPTVYAYKTTEKRPVGACEGTRYSAWREKFVKELLTPERIALIGAYWRAHPKTGRWQDDRMPLSAHRKYLAEKLGEDHPLVEFYASVANAASALTGHDEYAIRQLADRNGLTFSKSAAHFAYAALKKRYPLVARAGWQNLWNEGYGDDAKNEREEWIEYVQLRDLRDAPATNNVVQLKSVP